MPSMHSATNGHESQVLLLASPGQHGISSAIAVSSAIDSSAIAMSCAAASAAAGIDVAMTGAASGASNSPAATANKINTLANLLRRMSLCRMNGAGGATAP